MFPAALLKKEKKKKLPAFTIASPWFQCKEMRFLVIFVFAFSIHRCYWPEFLLLCQRSWVRPSACGLGAYSRPLAQFFPIWTDLGRQITCLLFSYVEYFVSSFCVEFSLQPFSNLVYACVWHLGNRKSTWRSFAFLCFLGHYLDFTFFAVKKKCWKRRESWKISSFRTRGPDRWSARN